MNDITSANDSSMSNPVSGPNSGPNSRPDSGAIPSSDSPGSPPTPTAATAAAAKTASASLEVEVKFAAPESAVVPGFDFVPGVGSVEREVREMSATYVDTADLRLTRAKRTLRRRTGGPDEGWHLKTPAEAGRMEYGAPLGDGSVAGDGPGAVYTVPEVLLAPVRAIVREHPLVPIARVDNVRHVSTILDVEGTAVAEFCDDHVTATSLLPGGGETTWREWEVELIGDMSTSDAGADLLERLGAVLRIAGATPSDSPSKLATALGDSIDSAPTPPAPARLPKGTPGRAVVDALAANVAKMVEWDPKVRRDEWDSVHQMRVATRELRSHMQTFHGILVGDGIGHMEAELKLLAGVLGVARDAEVVAERFESQLTRDDAAIIGGGMREELVADIRRDYDRAHRRVVAALDSSRYLTILDQLDELLADPPINPSGGDEAHDGVDGDQDAGAGAEVAADAEVTTDAESATDAELATDIDVMADEDVVDVVKQAPATPAPAATDEPSTDGTTEKTPEQIRAETTVVLAAHLATAFGKFKKKHRLALAGHADEALSAAERDNRFHDVRKAAKKVRYSAEAAQSAGLPTKKLYAACKALQSSLGDFQDTCTAREVLLQKSRRAHSHGQDTFGYGVLYQIERMDGLAALDAYDDDVKAVIRAYAKLEAALAKAAKKSRKAAGRRDR